MTSATRGYLTSLAVVHSRPAEPASGEHSAASGGLGT
jgi:hypothetical protein